MSHIERVSAQRIPPDWTFRAKTEVLVGGYRVDMPAEITSPAAETVVLAVEIKRLVEPRRIPEAAQLIRAITTEQLPRAVPVVAAAYLSPRSRELLRDLGVGYVDTTGNIAIRATTPGLLISADGVDRDPWPQRSGLRSLRGRGAGRAVRAIVDTVPPFGIRELALETGASAPTRRGSPNASTCARPTPARTSCSSSPSTRSSSIGPSSATGSDASQPVNLPWTCSQVRAASPRKARNCCDGCRRTKMSGAPDPLYVRARAALLDAADALAAHLHAIVLVGAQAVYVHTGEADPGEDISDPAPTTTRSAKPSRCGSGFRLSPERRRGTCETGDVESIPRGWGCRRRRRPPSRSRRSATGSTARAARQWFRPRIKSGTGSSPE